MFNKTEKTKKPLAPLGRDGDDSTPVLAQPHTVSSVIQAILSLSDAEKQKLPAVIRTTPTGIQAYTTFLYGAASGADDVTTSTNVSQ